ncbi:MAG TPA: translation elongation factor Ts [Bryobacteraceae bacterium]|nr:translation elongation factor Ts [Bryobacteraceae bacterium]
MAEITAQMVKALRDKTQAGMMDCRKALVEANGDLVEAEVILRKKGMASAAKKAGRAARMGQVGTYIHPGGMLGVLVEVNCETDFVARTDQFQELVKDISMQIAAADPRYLKRDEVPSEILEKEKEIARDRARAEGKPEKILDKIVEGRLAKFFEEVCLLDQPFIKDNTQTIDQLIKSKIASLQENIGIARFARFKVGETAPVETTEAAE